MATTRAVDPPVARHGYGLLALFSVLGAVGALAAAATYLVYQWERSLLLADFEFLARVRALTIQKEINAHADFERALGNVFTVVPAVDRKMFGQLVGARLGEHRAINAMMWAPVVDGAQRSVFEERARADGVNGYRIMDRVAEANGMHEFIPAAQRERYLPVLYLASNTVDASWLGFDLQASAEFRPVIDAACESGWTRTAITKRVTEPSGRPAATSQLLFATPVYREGGAFAQTRAARCAQLRGVVVESLALDRLVDASLGGEGMRGIDITFYDEGDTVGGDGFFFFPSRTRDASPSRGLQTRLGAMQWQASIDVPGATWTLLFTPAPLFLETHPYWRTMGTAAASAALGLVLIAYLVASARRRYRIERLAGRLADANRSLTREVRERRKVEEELRIGEQRLFEAQRIVHLGNWTWEVEGDQGWWSEEQMRIFGINATAFRPTMTQFLSRVHEDDRPLFDDARTAAVEQGRSMDLEVRIVRPDGVERDVHVRAEAVTDHTGKVVRLAGTVHDITERKCVEAQMKMLSGALEQTGDAVMITDTRGVITYVNAAFEAMTGYTSAEVLGNTPAVIKSDRHDKEFFARLWRTLGRGEVFRDIFVNRRKDGELFYAEQTIAPIKDRHGRVTAYIATGKEITKRMQDQERLEHLAYHDLLTELPNRALFMDRLGHGLLRRRESGSRLAVLFLDADGFKEINDTLGHDTGDRLLQLFAERIKTCMREGDSVARIGGDEFAVLLEEIASADDVVAIAQKIQSALTTRPFQIGDHRLVVSASIGISVFPDDGEDPEGLLKCADTAMYRAKKEGRNNYQFYSGVLSPGQLQRLSYESNIHRALERGELLLYYQPQVDLGSGRAVGFGAEALLRWQHPEKGLVSAQEFIPLLERLNRSEVIREIGEWVLNTAAEQVAAWQRAGAAPLRVSVNISGRHFHDAGLHSSVGRILDATHLEADCLELEITEGVLMAQDDTMRKNIAALKERGVRLAIDDFGIGYSSLSYLKHLPVSTLKIDRSFVSDVARNPEDASIVSAIIALAHSLNVEVIAEGVENTAQMDFLRRQGCHAMQGFLFSRPLSTQDMTRLLSA